MLIGPDDIIDHPLWTEGDFALISQNNIRFRVDAIHLMAAR
jgi:hypothetical protein